VLSNHVLAAVGDGQAGCGGDHSGGGGGAGGVEAVTVAVVAAAAVAVAVAAVAILLPRVTLRSFMYSKQTISTVIGQSWLAALPIIPWIMWFSRAG